MLHVLTVPPLRALRAYAPQTRQKTPKLNTIENHFSPQTQSQNPRRALRATNATKKPNQTKIKNVDVLTEPCVSYVQRVKIPKSLVPPKGGPQNFGLRSLLPSKLLGGETGIAQFK